MSAVTIQLNQKGKTASLIDLGDTQLIIDRPKELGGNGEGPMGGQVMLMGIGGCFASTLYAAAHSRQIEITNLKIAVHGRLSESLPKRFVAIDLEILSGQASDENEFEKLLKIAEKGCISVNTIINNVALTVKR